MKSKVETLDRRQLANIPEFEHYAKSYIYELYKRLLIESGVDESAITRYTRLKIVDLSLITNMSEEHIRLHMDGEAVRRAS